MKRKNNKKQRRKERLMLTLVGALAVGILIAVAVMLMVSPKQTFSDSPALPESAGPDEAVTTSATAAVTTQQEESTTTTHATTTREQTTVTTPENASFTEDVYSGRKLLQYDTAGRYVQKDSYPDGKTVPWNLLLVNDWNPLPANYDATITLASVGSQQVDARMLSSLQAMLEAGKAYGIGVQSGYRSAQRQSVLYWRQVDSYGGSATAAVQQKAGTVVKRPGYSEHNCGLAVDLGGSGNFKLEEDFATTPAYDWLINHCAEYGFILRFPKHLESVTGVIYEPWHYRYVGVDAAKAIMSENSCLEQYLEKNKE